MTCPRCDFVCDDTATFCLNCGTRLAEQPSSDVPSSPEEPSSTVTLTPLPSESPAMPQEDVSPSQPSSQPPASMPSVVPPPPFQKFAPIVPPPIPPLKTTGKPVSVWKWLGLMLLESFVGIAHLVLMFVYAFSDNANESLKNYSRAKLIVAALKLVVGAILFFLAFSAIMEFVEMALYYSYTNPM